MRFINYLGVWCCFCAIDKYVLVFQERSFIMAFGVIAYFSANYIADYIEK